MIAVVGFVVVAAGTAVIIDGTYVRVQKKPPPATSVSSTDQSAGDDSTATSSAIMAKLIAESGGASPSSTKPKNTPAESGTSPGDKTTALANQTAAVSPTQQLVQQAWVQYVSGVIQQTQKLTDQRRRALSSGLAASSGGSSGAAGAVRITPASFTPPDDGNPLAGMISGATPGQNVTPNDGGVGNGAVSFDGGSAGDSAALSAAQKSSYLGKLRGNPDYLPTGREAPISPNVLRAGSVIPAVMETGIDSDLPGQILARVASNVYNTPDGSEVLVPQGAELIGTYDDQVANGQSRVLVVWNRIIYPDGSSLDIDSMPGSSPSGYAGFHDQVNNHYFRIFSDALLMSVFSAGVQLSQPQASPSSTYSSQQVIAGSLGQQLGQTGQNLINRDIGIAPTLKIRQGYKFDVMITRDLVIKPWQSVASLSSEAGNDSPPETNRTMWIAEPLQHNHLSHQQLVVASADNGAASRSSGKPQSLLGTLPATPPSPRNLSGVVSVPSLPVPPNAVAATSLPPVPPPPPTWSLPAGQLVGRQISTWGESAGWHVIWNVGQDWPVPRASNFQGTFSGAASQVIEDLAAQGAPIHATFYRGNHTLVVTGVNQ
ncbi:Toxin co-regulated pilus biosynthesis protein Q [Acidocella aminolytica 101 = DSM 11237]|nr:TrbI/VirB10 family protein [Acidocella aminolytica]SHF60079.1 Toxin co-regulated pilus biosynthesis protein Q [Acidocella aminolytica 101 = DSM 11237]